MTTATKRKPSRWEPTIEQLRREYDRRNIAGRGKPRDWPKCQGSIRHRVQAWRASLLSDREIRRRLVRAAVRFDPPPRERECPCGVTMELNW